MRSTKRQRAIIHRVIWGHRESTYLTMEELRDEIARDVSVQALQCSVRILEKNGMLVREKISGRVRIKPTPRAISRFTGASIDPHSVTIDILLEE